MKKKCKCDKFFKIYKIIRVSWHLGIFWPSLHSQSSQFSSFSFSIQSFHGHGCSHSRFFNYQNFLHQTNLSFYFTLSSFFTRSFSHSESPFNATAADGRRRGHHGRRSGAAFELHGSLQIFALPSRARLRSSSVGARVPSHHWRHWYSSR